MNFDSIIEFVVLFYMVSQACDVFLTFFFFFAFFIIYRSHSIFTSTYSDKLSSYKNTQDLRYL